MNDVIVYPRKRYVLGIAIVASVLAVLALIVPVPGLPSLVSTLTGWGLLAAAVVWLVSLVRGGTYIRLSEDGLAYRYSFLMKWFYPWERCSAFQTYFPKLGDEDVRSVHFFATRPTGKRWPYAFGDMWELRTVELAAELNRFRDAALARSAAATSNSGIE